MCCDTPIVCPECKKAQANWSKPCPHADMIAEYIRHKLLDATRIAELERELGEVKQRAGEEEIAAYWFKGKMDKAEAERDHLREELDRTKNPKAGTCCSCGYMATDEGPCPASPDGFHCDHWDALVAVLEEKP